MEEFFLEAMDALSTFVLPSESKLKEEKTNMASLKEEAKNYVPKKTKNIADLDIVPIDINLEDGKGTDDKGVEFDYKYFEQDKEEYRVPNSVIEQIQTIMKENPKLTHVKVIKKGTGFDTKYTVVQKDPSSGPTETASIQA